MRVRARAAAEVARGMAHEWREDRVGGLAAEVAFFGVLSLFPGFLALAAALGSLDAVVGADVAAQAEEQVLSFLRRVLTDDAGGTVDAVARLFQETNAGLLTLGTVGAVWAASRAFAAVLKALSVAYDVEENRGYVRLRLTAAGLALGTVLLASVVLGMIVLGPLLGSGRQVADRIGLGSRFAALWDWVRWPVVLAAMVLWAATVLHVGPDHRTRWRWDLPGAALTAAAWAAVSVGLRAYLSLAGAANQVLGTLGGVLIVLLWLYLLAAGLLLGAELNGVLAARFSVPQLPRRPSQLRRRLAGLRRRWRRR